MQAALHVNAGDAGLVLVDAQVKLAGAMPPAVLERNLRNWLLLIETAARFKMPIAVSEQYPKGLGPVLPVLKEALSKALPAPRWLEKIEFSCCDAPLFDQFLGVGRKTWIVCGMETHVCVWQTVRGLTERGCRVQVPVDAVASRNKQNWRVGLDLCERAGAVVTSTETVVFDLLKRAGGDDFRALSKLIK
jgi:nicotinamidase-related amidase